MVDRETSERESRRLVSRLRFAGLRQNAVIEDIDLRAPRGLDKAYASETPEEPPIQHGNIRGTSYYH